MSSLQFWQSFKQKQKTKTKKKSFLCVFADKLLMNYAIFIFIYISIII